MTIAKNEVTADEIDALFAEWFCAYCIDSGICEGCIIELAAARLVQATPEAETPKSDNEHAMHLQR